MTLRPIVFLFDIDGTLLLTGGAGRRAMSAAFVALHDKADACGHFTFAGMTDRAIVREGIRALQAERGLASVVSEDSIDALLESYLAELASEIVTSRYQILPGVVDLLEHLANEPRFAIGLGTGNVRRGAETKLAHGGLWHRFAFGGFGCDAEDRTELLRVGAERGAELLATSLPECRVVVLGDTPKDVAAARGIGASCIGVGTGGYDPAELVRLGAVCAFPTLSDPGVRAAIADLAGR